MKSIPTKPDESVQARLDIADAIKSACANGFLPDHFEALADIVVNADNCDTKIWPCEVHSADFEASTVTLKMSVPNFQVSARPHWLIAGAVAIPTTKTGS